MNWSNPIIRSSSGKLFGLSGVIHEWIAKQIMAIYGHDHDDTHITSSGKPLAWVSLIHGTEVSIIKHGNNASPRLVLYWWIKYLIHITKYELVLVFFHWLLILPLKYFHIQNPFLLTTYLLWLLSVLFVSHSKFKATSIDF